MNKKDQEKITKTYGFDFPKEFYEIWELAKKIKPEKPLEAFRVGEGYRMDMLLCGPYEAFPDDKWHDFKEIYHEEGDPENYYWVFDDVGRGQSWGFVFEDKDHKKYKIGTRNYYDNTEMGYFDSLIDAIKANLKFALYTLKEDTKKGEDTCMDEGELEKTKEFQKLFLSKIKK